MPRSIPLKTLFACTMLLAAALPARAQSTPGTPEPAEQRINEAFATPYADAMIRTFVKSVRRSVDSACLEQKAFDDAAIAARGRALLQRYGTQMLKLINDGVVALVTAAKDGTIVSGNFFGDVGLADFHDLADAVPADVKAQIDELTPQVISGDVPTGYTP